MRLIRGKTLFVTGLAAAFFYAQPWLALANPQDGIVSAGQATISEADKKLDVNQQSAIAVIDWRGFDIAPDEHTEFHQPSANAIAVNRVNSHSSSHIDGQLTANGNVVIINQNGVVFGASANVDVNGLVVSTADADNENIMGSKGKIAFDKPGNADASIVNDGTINAKDAGLVGFVAPNVINHGVIKAKLGKIQLASGDTATVDMYGDGLMEVAVSDNVKSQLVSNTGLIEADGGTIALTAAAGQNIVNSLISVEGTLRAQSVGQKNGKIIIFAEGSNAVAGNVAANKGKKQGSSKVVIAGTLDVSGKNPGETGGTISVLADEVTVRAGAHLDATGDAGGGTIHIGGDFHGEGITPTAYNTMVESGAYIEADALTSGNGGNVVVWADNSTNFQGTVSISALGEEGDGGSAETSGHMYLFFNGRVYATSRRGRYGNLLLDPADIVIANGSFDSAADGTGTFSGNPSGAAGTIASGDTAPTTIYESELEGISATTNISLTATNSITLSSLTTDGNLNLAQTAGHSVTFSAGASGFTMANPGNTITTNGGNLNITTTGGASTIGKLTTGVGTVTFNIGGTATASGVISNSGGIVKSGSGTLTLSGANTYTGTTTVTGGTLSAGNIVVSAGSSNLGNAASAVILETGGILSYSGSTATYLRGLTIDSGIGEIDNAGAGILTIGTGGIVTTGGTFQAGGSGATSVTGIISGTGGVTKIGTGTLTLSGSNSFSNGLTIKAGEVDGSTSVNAFGGTGTGTITLGDSAGGSNNANMGLFGALTFANPIVLASNTTGTLSIVTNPNQSAVLSGGITGTNHLTINDTLTPGHLLTISTVSINNTGTITQIGTGGGGTTISSIIGTNVTGVIQNSSTALLTLTGNNSFTSGLTIKAGTVTGTTSTGAFGAGNVTLGDSAGGSNNATLLGVGLTFANPIILASTTTGTLTLAANNSGSVVFSGGITGTNNLTLDGGTGNKSVTLSTASVNNAGIITNSSAAGTGTSTISGGVGSNVIGITENSTTSALTIGTTALTVNGTATTLTNALGTKLLTVSGGITGTGNLILNNNSSLANGITVSGTSLNNTGTVTNSGSGSGTTAISAVIGTNVTGVTQNSSTSQLTLSGANGYTSTTTVSAGTLAEGANNALASGAVTVSGGTFDMSSFSDTVGAVTLTSGSITGTTGVLTGTSYDMRSGTVSAILAGTGALTKSTAGTVTLSGTNTYTGVTTINAGTLSVGTIGNGGVAGNLGAATNAAANLVLGGGTLQYTGATASTDRNYTLTAATTNSIDVSTGATTLTLSGASTNTTGALTKLGGGALTLSGANLYTGATNVNAGTLQAGAANVLGGASSTSALVMGGGTFDMNGFNEAVGSITGTGSITSTAAGNIALTAGNDNTSPAAYSGTILAGSSTSLGLTKVGSGTLTLSGTNTYTGATTVNAGVLSVATIGNGGASGNLGAASNAAANLVLGGGTLQYTGATASTDRNFTLTAATTSSIDVSTGAATLTLSGASANTTGGLTKIGAGTLTLSGANLHTGATTVNAGTLKYGANNVIASGAVIVGAAGTLNLNSFSDTIASITNNGAVTFGTGNTLTTAGAQTYNGTITGNGITLVSSGGGTLSATNALNDFTGNVTVSTSGNASVVDANALSLGTVSAGTFFAQALAGNLTLTGQVQVTGTTGTALVLSTSGNFINSFGATALQTGAGGRWIVYSSNPGLDTPGGLSQAQTIYGQTYATEAPGTVPNTSQNTWIYSAINLGTITITASGQTVGYGTAPSTAATLNTTYSCSGSGGACSDINGAPVISISGVTSSATSGSYNAGTWAGDILSALGTLAINSGYVGTFSFANGDLTVTPRSITVTAATNTKTYDGALSAAANPTITAGTLLTGDTANFTEAYSSKNAGTSLTITPTGSVTDGNSGNNYNVTFANNTTGIINARPITITADAAQTKIYGASDPGSYSYGITSGNLVGGDSLSGALSRTAGSNVGNYAIGQNSLTAGSNYTLTYAGDNFAITARPITVTADAGQTKIYGATDPGSYGYSITTGSLVGGDSLSGALSRAAGSNVGNYAIGQNSLTAGSNYTLTYAGNNFAITANSITVTANAGQTKIYGAADGTYSYSITSGSLVGSDSLSGVLSRTAGSSIGNYAILQNGLTAGSNYTLTYAGDNFAITARPITVTADAGQTKIYGATDPGSYTYSITTGSLVGGDSLSGVLSRTAGSSIGNYAILQNGLTAGSNYTLTYAGDNFAITARPITVTADAAQTKIYGAADPGSYSYGITAGSLVGGDSLSGALSRTAGSNVGNYAIGQNTLTAGSNYTLTYAGDNFAITVRPITITADAGQSKIYSAADPGSYSYSITSGSLVGGDSLNGALSRAAGSNVGNYAIGQNTLTAGSNYTLTYAGDNFAITARPITVTADAGQTKIYGAADPGSYSYSITTGSLVGGDSLSGALSRAAGSNVGNYAIGQNTLTASSNYTLTYAGNNFAITARPITITADAGQTKIYGAADPGSYSYSITTGSLVGGDSLSGALSRAVGSNVGSYVIGQNSLTAGSNYTLTYAGDNFAITARPITVTASAGQSKIYGAADPGSYSYSITTGSLVGGDSLSGALSRAAGSNVGNYAILQNGLTAGSNYTLTYAGNNFAITARPITITADAGQSKVYGAADPGSYTYSITSGGLVGGDSLSGALSRTAGSNVGNYAILQNGLTAGSNYTLTYAGNSFAITARPITLTADAGQSKTYGAADPGSYTYSITSGGLVGGDSLSGALSRAAGNNVGNYAIGQNTLTAGSNYTLTYAGNNFAITARPITVTADTGQSKIYGAVDPGSYSYSITSGSLVSGDSLSGTLSRATGNNVGNYTIGQNTLAASSNYTLTYAGDNFAITARPITITASAGQSKVYGSADPGSYTYSISSGSLVGGDSLSGSLSRTAGSNVGNYAILQNGLTAGSNYTLTYAGNSFAITARPITITASAGQSKVYGNADPGSYTYSITSGSLVGGDSLSGVLSRAAGSNVGNYSIGQNSLTAGSNYTLTYAGNNFAITARPITVTANAGQGKTYGAAEPSYSYSLTSGSLIGGDSFSGALSRAAGSNVGNYAIGQNTLSAGSNYTLTYVGGNFSITPASLNVTANDKTRAYGDNNPPFDLRFSGLVNGDNTTVFTGYTLGTAATSASDVGAYAINLAGGSASNYAVTRHNGTLAITSGSVPVTPDPVIPDTPAAPTIPTTVLHMSQDPIVSVEADTNCIIKLPHGVCPTHGYKIGGRTNASIPAQRHTTAMHPLEKQITYTLLSPSLSNDVSNSEPSHYMDEIDSEPKEAMLNEWPIGPAFAQRINVQLPHYV